MRRDRPIVSAAAHPVLGSGRCCVVPGLGLGPHRAPSGATVVMGSLLAVLVAVLAGSPPSLGAVRGPPTEACRSSGLSRSYVAAVAGALRARRDVWGTRLLDSRGGPTYQGVQRYLKPLLLAG